MEIRDVHPDAGDIGSIGFPADLRSLTSLRYLAAFWVVTFHYHYFFFGADAKVHPLLWNGWLGVDFFFILSGFVLAHVYLPQMREGRFDYWQFLGRRIARVYPLHLLTFALMLAFALIARKQHWHFSVFDPAAIFELPVGDVIRTIFANLLLTHSWGATNGLYLNSPSWSISAEWFAYLVFPLFAAAAGFGVRHAGWRLAIAVAILLCVATLAVASPHFPYYKTTWNLGILRIAPEFFFGVALYVFGARHSAGKLGAAIGLIVSLMAAIAILMVGLPTTLAVIALGAVILFAADLERHVSIGVLTHSFPVLLGEVSYAVYMFHYGVGILMFDLVLPASLRTPAMAAPVIVGVLMLVTLISYCSHRWFELPTRRWMIARVSAIGRGGRPQQRVAELGR